MQWYFWFFLISGFCSILYEIIWLRIAMAQFGVTTAMVSLVLSAFMVGLGLGSWGSGWIARRYAIRRQVSALRLYALMELLIGVAAIAVPYELFWGRELLLRTIREMSLSSAIYYLPSGMWLALTLVPWCACMGATFPFAMAAIQQERDPGAKSSFSYLYLANVLGATAGAVVPLLLVEILGFRLTLRFAAVLNLLLAASAFTLSLSRRPAAVAAPGPPQPSMPLEPDSLSDSSLLWFLFGTGLTSMGAEVVWVRLYTPFLGTLVYAFAAILGLYLIAMYSGSWIYRRRKGVRFLDKGLWWIVLGASVVVAFLTADPRAPLPAILRVALGIMPFSALVGFLTPAILDRFSQGDADRAGTAYAINIVGCVLGPLLAGFVLLPLIGERVALCILALPWFLVGLRYRPTSILRPGALLRSPHAASFIVLILGSVAVAFSTKGFEDQFSHRKVKRDSTATVVASRSPGGHMNLFINGVGMTALSPVTKMMVHLPMAFLPRKPENGLVICFGMGTSHLAMLSWKVPATVVELVPSVPSLVTFFHPTADSSMDSPLSHVVIDDGRFYLERTSDLYDVIAIDPPPPISAAGSSLLYSTEFYTSAKRHLRSGGILQQWMPGGPPEVTASVARALAVSFPYVRAFHSRENVGGVHFLASMTPIPNLSAAELADRLPKSATENLLEWEPTSQPQEIFQLVLTHEVSMDTLTHQYADLPVMQDDHPVNEYFILRRLRDPEFRQMLWQYLFRHGRG